MDWIKMILEKHTKEDGTVDLAAANKEIDAEFPKNAVPKTDFNSKVEELKTANETLTTLQNSNKDNEELQTKISEYEAKMQQLETERAEERKTFTIKEALTKAGVADVDYMMFKLGQLETDKDGNVVDLDNKVKALQEANPTFFSTQPAGVPAGQQAPGYKVIDNKLPTGNQTPSEPQSLAEAIEQQYKK